MVYSTVCNNVLFSSYTTGQYQTKLYLEIDFSKYRITNIYSIMNRTNQTGQMSFMWNHYNTNGSTVFIYYPLHEGQSLPSSTFDINIYYTSK